MLSAAAASYWRDMERANPWMMIDGEPEDGNSLNGHKNRHGVVAKRWTAKMGWMRWRKGRWEKVVLGA